MAAKPELLAVPLVPDRQVFTEMLERVEIIDAMWCGRRWASRTYLEEIEYAVHG